MIRYHATNGPSGELCIDWDGEFVGFIVEAGPMKWRAYTRTMELIGDSYQSRADAATACRHAVIGPPVPIGSILACVPLKPPATDFERKRRKPAPRASRGSPD